MPKTNNFKIHIRRPRTIHSHLLFAHARASQSWYPLFSELKNEKKEIIAKQTAASPRPQSVGQKAHHVTSAIECLTSIKHHSTVFEQRTHDLALRLHVRHLTLDRERAHDRRSEDDREVERSHLETCQSVPLSTDINIVAEYDYPLPSSTAPSPQPSPDAQRDTQARLCDARVNSQSQPSY